MPRSMKKIEKFCEDNKLNIVFIEKHHVEINNTDYFVLAVESLEDQTLAHTFFDDCEDVDGVINEILDGLLEMVERIREVSVKK
jgi:hypothetical protein